jgi:hypothetical protein
MLQTISPSSESVNLFSSTYCVGPGAQRTTAASPESWSKYEIKKTIKKIWEAYNKTCVGSNGCATIPEPKE